MARRLVIERLSEGSVPVTDEARKVDAPSLAAIRLVFGVGKGADAHPDEAGFKPVYTVAIPVFSLGGLDSDGVYEFDAASLLETLQARARRRKWALRLELELAQTADAVTSADLYVDSPYPEDGPTIALGGRGRAGTPTPGGGRSLVIVSSLAHDREDVLALGGRFTVQLGDADPQRGETASVASPVREIRLDLGQYEFEG